MIQWSVRLNGGIFMNYSIYDVINVELVNLVLVYL